MEDLRLEDILMEYQFTKIINTPWKEMSAYKLGIVNDSGKILKTRRQLKESSEKQAYPDKFFALSWTVKKIVEQFDAIPNRSSALVKTLWSLKSEYSGLNPEKYESIVMEYFKSKKTCLKTILHIENNLLEAGVYQIYDKKYRIKHLTPIGEVFGVPVYKIGKQVFTYTEAKKLGEDGAAVAGPANNVGGGQMAGVSPGQEPPMPKGSTSMQKRKKIQRRQQDRIQKDIQTLNIIDPKK